MPYLIDRFHLCIPLFEMTVCFQCTTFYNLACFKALAVYKVEIRGNNSPRPKRIREL